MKKKIKIYISIMIFCSFCANSFLVRGIEVTYSFTEIGSIASNSNVISVECYENELAFLAADNNRLAVHNITNPSNCTELDYFPLSYVHDIALDLERELVYITASTGVNIFNYSNPNQLEFISSYLNYTHSTFIQLEGDLLYVSAEDYGLQIVNVTDPYEPIMVGKWEDSIGHVGPTYILDNYAFVGLRVPNVGAHPTAIGLKVLDISDPTNITYISTVDTGEGYNGGSPKAHINNLAYFTDHDNGLKILNFTDPYDVTVLGNYNDGGSINDLKIINSDITFLADDGEGLQIVNCANPENPFLVSSYQHQWRTIKVEVQEERVYLATLGGGVRILSAETKTRKTEVNPFFIVSGLTIASILLLVKRKKK